jgi:hypothetical protein
LVEVIALEDRCRCSGQAALAAIFMGGTRRMESEPSEAAIIRRLEEQLLDSNVRTCAATVANLLADDFVEFGSSGRVFNKQQIIASLQQEDGACRRSMHDFQMSRLAPGIILATYRVSRESGNGIPSVESLRSSIWKLQDGHWQMVFHQGTLIGNR